MSRTRVKALVVALAALLCALTAAGGVDMVVLGHRLRHVSVAFPSGGGGSTWLIVGSDVRPGHPASAVRFAGQRADVLLLVHLGPPASSIISMPRDLLLRTPQGGVERAALTFDSGAQALVDGLCRTLAVPVDHLAIVTMHGFADIVDALGGLTVELAQPVRDPAAQLEIDRAGAVRISGEQALALVRSRHPQHLVDGRWLRSRERAGALARARNAAAVFAALRARARAERRNPIVVQRALWAASGAVTLDSGARLTDLLALLTTGGRYSVLPAAPLPRTIAVLADSRSRAALTAAGYPTACIPAPRGD